MKAELASSSNNDRRRGRTLEQAWELPRGESQSLTHVKLKLLEIAGEVCVAMSEQVSESIGGLFGQHEPDPFRIFDNRDWREIGSWKYISPRYYRGFDLVACNALLVHFLWSNVLVPEINLIRDPFEMQYFSHNFPLSWNLFIRLKLLKTNYV